MTWNAHDLWVPIRRGLIVDPAGKHIGRLGQAVWLLEYCFLFADWQTGVLVRKQARIVEDMGMPPRTVRDWMRRLVRKEYVSVRRSGRASRITVLRWRPLRRRSAALSGRIPPIRAARNGHGRSRDRRNGKESRHEIAAGARPNNSLFTKFLSRDGQRSPPDAEREARIGLLARDLAEGLGAPNALEELLDLARRYPEPLLRETLSRVRSVPPHEIRRSPTALFKALLSRHGNSSPQNPGH